MCANFRTRHDDGCWLPSRLLLVVVVDLFTLVPEYTR